MPTTILLVEDEPLLASLYTAVLMQRAFKVVTAAEESEAIRVFRKTKPSLILLDLMIPTVAQHSRLYDFHDPVGYEVLKFVRKNAKGKRTTKVVILSNLDSDEHRQRARDLGADDFWVKASFDPHDLPRRVDAMLAQP